VPSETLPVWIAGAEQHRLTPIQLRLARVWRGEADQDELDVYVRQRRAATVEQVQQMSIRNKRQLEERDLAVQRAHLAELMEIAADPRRARAHLLDTSMISGLRRSQEIR
jgi:3-(3-hydroxy-phenyl)propionate hydroxylase